jgi:hypothetical protein
MTSILTGFNDGSAWEHRADGIYAVARNDSWAERVRGGLPIDYLMAIQAPEDAPVAPPRLARSAIFEPHPVWPFRASHTANWDELEAEPEDFDAYFAPVEPRHKARARRTKGSVKVSKYGPKASKARTVAATVLAEPVAPSGHLTRDATEDYCFVCGSPQSTYLMNADTLSKARACDHCSPAFKAELAERDRVDAVVAETVDAQRAFALRWLAIGRLYMEWLNDLADYADDAGIEGPTEEDLEQERQLQRQRDARYERY